MLVSASTGLQSSNNWLTPSVKSKGKKAPVEQLIMIKKLQRRPISFNNLLGMHGIPPGGCVATLQIDHAVALWQQTNQWCEVCHSGSCLLVPMSLCLLLPAGEQRSYQN